MKTKTPTDTITWCCPRCDGMKKTKTDKDGPAGVVPTCGTCHVRMNLLFREDTAMIPVRKRTMTDSGGPHTWRCYIVDVNGNPGGTCFVDADDKQEALRLGGEQFGLKPDQIGKRSTARKED